MEKPSKSLNLNQYCDNCFSFLKWKSVTYSYSCNRLLQLMISHFKGKTLLEFHHLG